MEFKAIITLLSTVLSLTVALITFLLKSVKNGRAKKTLLHTLQISANLHQFVTAAEQFINYTGIEKKEFVMTKVNQLAIDNKIKINQEEISQMIDELVELTKKVNARPNSKTTDITAMDDKTNKMPIIGVKSANNKMIL